MVAARYVESNRLSTIWLLLLALILSAFPFGAVHAAEPVSPTQVSALIADLGNRSYHKRSAATAQLVTAGTQAVKPLLKAALSKDREIEWRARRILIRLAETSSESFDLLDSERQKKSPTAAIAKRIAETDSVVESQRKRSIRRVNELIKPARIALKKGQWGLAKSKAKAAERLARKLGVHDDCQDQLAALYVFADLRHTGESTKFSVSTEGQSKLAKALLERAENAILKSDYVKARRYALVAEKLDVRYSAFDNKPSVVLARIERLTRKSSSKKKTDD